MKLAVLALLAAIPAFAGCLGLPPDAARSGDIVTVRYDAQDLATGAVLVSGNVTALTIGAASAPLGWDVEHALLGKRTNETFIVESRDDPALRFRQTRTVSGELERFESEFDAPTGLFVSRFGEAEVGREYPFRELQLVVLATDENTTRLRYVIPDTTTPLPEFGVEVYWQVDGQEVVRLFRPGGEAVAFEVPQAGGPFPDPGTYRAKAAEGANVTFDYSPSLEEALLDRDIRFTVTILSVERGEASAPEPSLTPRVSPMAARDPRRLLT